MFQNFEAGTGKSLFLKVVMLGIKQVNVRAGCELKRPSILAILSTENVAFNVGSKTIESVLQLSGNN